MAWETSGESWSVVLLDGDELAGQHVGASARDTGEQLVCVMRDLLAAHALRVRDLHVLAVGTGPGSFTGVRIGLATALGLRAGAPALNLVGIDAFLLERMHAASTVGACLGVDACADPLVVTAIAAPPDDVYLEVVEAGLRTQTCVQRTAALPAFLHDLRAARARSAGNATAAKLVGRAWPAPHAEPTIAVPQLQPRAFLLARLARQALCGAVAYAEVRRGGDAEPLVPLYIGEPRIVVPKTRQFPGPKSK